MTAAPTVDSMDGTCPSWRLGGDGMVTVMANGTLERNGRCQSLTVDPTATGSGWFQG
jgi:hypothetical protein